MKKLQTLIFCFTIVLFYQYVDAQDRIIKRSGQEIKCKITEVGVDEIKYILSESAGDVIFGIDKRDVERIIFENGKEMNFKLEMESMDFYSTQRRNAIKTDFMMPLFGWTGLTFEHCIRPGRSVETSIGLIGLGRQFYDYQRDVGITIKAGYKFIQTPDFYLKGMRYAHILKGGYVRMEPAVSFISRNWHDEYNQTSGTDNIYRVAALVVLGRQWVYSDVFLLDFYGGVGFGLSNEWNNEHSEGAPGYGFIAATSKFPIAGTFGFRLGFLLPNKNEVVVKKKE
jgi:hypothetical protein